MATDYEMIRDDNHRAYGERGAIKIGQLTSQLLYADRTHFIYELLQNAEDALERRGQAWSGERGVAFILEADQLLIEHHGDPFTERDVKAICEFDESTKRENLTEIGSFGIGFKSVYAYTCEPRIFSGDERFAIRDYIYPHRIEHAQDEDSQNTVFVLPFKESALKAYNEIAEGLETLHRRTLLFLKNIEEINWRIESGTSGQYLRESKLINDKIRRTTLVSEDTADADTHQEEWLVFFRSVEGEGKLAGEIQVAFLLDSETDQIRAAKDCTLFARFATGIETRTGFLMDAPYQTTLSRDDVPPRESWNRYLIEETADLVVESLRYFRDAGLLNSVILNCLPLTELGNLPKPLLVALFDRTSQALKSERLLPGIDETYVSAQDALIPQTSDLRNLISSEQLSRLYSSEFIWLDASVTNNARLMNYVKNFLYIREVRPEEIVRRLTAAFLEDQTDVWIQDLYRFLQPQKALRRELNSIPIVRLSDGSHVTPQMKGLSQVYLPADEDTSFRTVRREVCEDETARAFLEGLGIREWDPIDDLIQNVLPKYRLAGLGPSLEEYADDVHRVLSVWVSSNHGMRTRLEQELGNVAWICTVDAKARSNVELCLPRDVYLATEEVEILFGGVGGFRIVDRSRACLIGTEIEALMKNCGSGDSLRPVRVSGRDRFTPGELSQMRHKTYPDLQPHDAWDYKIIDWHLHGLESLLAAIRNADNPEAKERANQLWNLLVDMKSYYFRGRYEWQHYKSRQCLFDSEFLLTLRNTAWVRDTSDVLHRPCDVVFEDLGWRHDEDLIRELKFKAPILEELANEAGLDVDVIRVLKSRIDEGMTLDEIKRSLGGSRAKRTRRRQDADSEERNFASAMLERQSNSPATIASASLVTLPLGGSTTREAAVTDRNLARELNRREGTQVKRVSHTELGPEGKALADEFRDMVEGDYGRRCQICGRTFAKSDGSQQVFVVHVVPPMRHSLSNYFGNLMGLCGWHFALLQHGECCWRTLEGNKPVEDEEQMRALILNLPEQIDDEGNTYRCLPIRFWNVYDEWTAEPTDVDAFVHYSNPHWRYLCELLRDDGKESS